MHAVQKTYGTNPTADRAEGRERIPKEMVSAIMIMPACHHSMLRYLLSPPASSANGSSLPFDPSAEELGDFSWSLRVRFVDCSGEISVISESPLRERLLAQNDMMERAFEPSCESGMSGQRPPREMYSCTPQISNSESIEESVINKTPTKLINSQKGRLEGRRY